MLTGSRKPVVSWWSRLSRSRVDSLPRPIQRAFQYRPQPLPLYYRLRDWSAAVCDVGRRAGRTDAPGVGVDGRSAAWGPRRLRAERARAGYLQRRTWRLSRMMMAVGWSGPTARSIMVNARPSAFAEQMA
jgi:hypothetical protein